MGFDIDRQIEEDWQLVRRLIESDTDISMFEERLIDRAVRQLLKLRPLDEETRRALWDVEARLAG